MELPSSNPFEVFRRECIDSLKLSIEKTCPKIITYQLSLESPPSQEFGDLASSICFELSKQLKMAPKVLAEMIVENLDLSKKVLVKSVSVAGSGYINFYAVYSKLSYLTIESAGILNFSYGHVKAEPPKKIIVEHTSVNPAGPVHVGTARNSIIGDSLYRLLTAMEHNVNAHFYVDDVGRQIAVLAYGCGMLDNLKPKGKTDHWIGFVYAMTSCIVEIQTLKGKIEKLEKENASDDAVKKTQSELDDWVSVAAELQDKNKELFNHLLERIKQDKNPENSIAKIMQQYERGETGTKDLIRKVVELCLEGFRETYNKVRIKWDSWDWESDFVWNGSVSEVVKKLGRTPYSTQVEGALALEVDKIATDRKLRGVFGVTETHEIPPLVLMRSDGTTLYSTRDIAYSLWKLSEADKVINVIGVEQSLAQLQLRIALSLLTITDRTKDMIHCAYELVKLPDYKMSKRRGRYVTFDEILDESVKRAKEEVEKRSQDLPDELKRSISEAVGVGAVKYALISVAPTKQVTFTWDKVLNFETNSAPFIQYAHARACNILKKAEENYEKPDYELLKEPAEHELVRKIAAFPETLIEAAEKLSPNSIAEFANDLASKFNSFYASLPVLQADSTRLRDARLSLVDAVRITLRNALNLLGIEALEKM